MYKIEWDSETGGVLLSSRVTKETLGIAPRPVFHEELDLIGLDRLGWTYPHGKAPIMWAVNKQYFYRGRHLFDAKGANIYDAPTLVMADGVEPMALEPVDVELMLTKNADQMFLIESEAIEFIRDTYVTYAGANRAHDAIRANKEADYEALAAKVEAKTKTKMAVVKEDCDSFDIVPLKTAKEEGKRVLLSTRIDRFIASFSGGKDSQVVLDLCTRAIPPTEFEVIYSDTGYELPPSLELYEQVKQYYRQRFPALKFSITRNHESVLNYWDKIGTPSDTHRWCCTVMKTAPLYRSLKVQGTNKQARVLTFDGVRAEESTRRSGYDRIGKGKHVYVYNAHPILNWNNVEIFMYLFGHSLEINDAYKHGKARVGCIICPFSTAWDDCVICRLYPKKLKPFTDKIEQFSEKARIGNFKTFLSERRWKLKILGNLQDLPQVIFSETKEQMKFEIHNPKQSFFSWLPVLCDFTIARCHDGIYLGELKFKDLVLSYKLREDAHFAKSEFIVDKVNDTNICLLLKRLAQKVAHCIQCEVCEVDCPTGALSIYPKINIDKSKCIHCHRCLNVHDRGCIVADCIRMVKDSDTAVKIYGYKKFGLRDEWVEDFMSDPIGFWNNNNWGKPMYESFKRWAKDALIIDSRNELTDLGRVLREIYVDNPTLVWEIIWINLCYNSYIVGKFCVLISQGQPFNVAIVKDKILEIDNASSATTLGNACVALMDMLSKSPLGKELAQGIPDGKMLVRKPYLDLSIEAIAYSVYLFAEKREANVMRVSDIYDSDVEDGVSVQFGLGKKDFLKGLRTISNQPNRVLIAELNMGLDHISLINDMSALDVLKKMAL